MTAIIHGQIRFRVRVVMQERSQLVQNMYEVSCVKGGLGPRKPDLPLRHGVTEAR